jgi:hypothetical protein
VEAVSDAETQDEICELINDLTAISMTNSDDDLGWKTSYSGGNKWSDARWVWKQRYGGWSQFYRFLLVVSLFTFFSSLLCTSWILARYK